MATWWSHSPHHRFLTVAVVNPASRAHYSRMQNQPVRLPCRGSIDLWKKPANHPGNLTSDGRQKILQRVPYDEANAACWLRWYCPYSLDIVGHKQRATWVSSLAAPRLRTMPNGHIFENSSARPLQQHWFHFVDRRSGFETGGIPSGSKMELWRMLLLKIYASKSAYEACIPRRYNYNANFIRHFRTMCAEPKLEPGIRQDAFLITDAATI